MEHHARALSLRCRLGDVRRRVELCRRELERQDLLLKALSRPSTAAPAPKRRAARWPYALLVLAALGLSPRPVPTAAPLVRAPEPAVEDEPGVREALALVYDFPDPATGALMLEVLAPTSQPPEVERLGDRLYWVRFGDYRFEVDLADASVRPLTSDSILAASSRSF